MMLLLAFATLALAAQDDVAPLLRDLEDDSPDIRAQAVARLRELGPTVLPILKKSEYSHARDLAARLEWEPFVPLWVEARDPGIFGRLAGGDPAAYDDVIRYPSRHYFLDRKVLADGGWALKKRVLAGYQESHSVDSSIGLVIDALLAWDHAACPLEEEFIRPLTLAIIASASLEHRERLKRLAAGHQALVSMAATLALAALGDKTAADVAVRQVEGGPSWRRLPAIRALKRTPVPSAGPPLRDLLRCGDSDTIFAALSALEAYPDLDLRAELPPLLTFAGKDESVAEGVHARALHHLAMRKIDETKRIWPLVKQGAFKSEGIRWKDNLSPLEIHLAQALLVADAPVVLDWLEELETLNWGVHVGMRDELANGAPPRLEAYLRDVAAGRKEAPKAHLELAKKYVEEHRPRIPPLSPEEAFALLEKGAGPRSLEAFDAIESPERLPLESRRRFVDRCKEWAATQGNPLRPKAAILLRRLGHPEGVEALLDLARDAGPQQGNYLSYLYREERARPILLEKLKREKGEARWSNSTLYLLAQLQDEVVPPLVLEAFRNREYLTFGEGLWAHLKPFESRDFSDDLLAILKDDTPPAHVDQILKYLAWKDRKDKIPLFRTFINHPHYDIRNTVITALGKWGDMDSYDRIEARTLTPDSSSDLYIPFGALMRLDPVRARRLMRSRLDLPPSPVRGAVKWMLGRMATPADAKLLARVVVTEGGGDEIRAAGQLRIAEAFESLLEIAEEDSEADRALAHYGDRRAIPVLARQIEGDHWKVCANSLDYIVNRDRYPDLGMRLPLKEKEHSRPFTEGAAKVKRVFGMDLGLSPRLGTVWLTFYNEEESLFDWLEWQCFQSVMGGRFAHLWCNGRVELIPFEEAREYWRAWWKEHSAEFAPK